MNIFKVFVYIFLSLYVLLMLYFIAKIKNRKNFLLIYTAVSIISLVIINLTSGYSNIKIPINECTVIGTLIGNVPALCLFTLLKYIFIL